MYLPLADFKGLPSFVAEQAGPGSAVVFDFLPPGVEDGTIPLKVGRTMHNWAKKRGEPFQFGMTRPDMEKLLRETGFRDIQCIPAQDLGPAYFHGPNQERKISELFSFATARRPAR